MPTDGSRPPSRAVSLAVSALLVALWAYIRIVVFAATAFPLTYVLPLLICVWSRDRLALWSMASIFALLHTAKLFWLLPAGTVSPAELRANFAATMLNLAIGATAVHVIIRLRSRLDRALDDVHAQADQLREQAEELSQQNEELSQQAEELTNQSEEMAQQNEALQVQADEIGLLNEMLERRELLLQKLLETARVSGTEHEALQHIVGTALDLIGGAASATAFYEQTSTELCLRAIAGEHANGEAVDRPVVDAFVSLAIANGRPASLNDASLRPDLTLAALDGHRPFRAVLCAPVVIRGRLTGALAVYATHPYDWTDEQFHVTEWLAEQCGRAVTTLRVQSELRDEGRRKGEFLATLSHELRNPLAPIGFALSMIEAGAGAEKQANAVRIMRRQLRQLVRLVDDLLDATRMSSNKVQIRKVRADLVAIVQHVLEAVRPDVDAAGHTVRASLPADPVWLDADSDRIAQVLMNLLNNAIRYTSSGGTITVTVSTGRGEARLTVADTGVGLERADLERVFDMFTQVGGPGSGGLGIGLALVRGIVTLHGGRVEAHSDGRNRGAEFRVMLPLAEGGSATVHVDRAAAPAGRASRVLVVDDNADSADLMASLLQMHGHVVHVAHDAEQALAGVHSFAPDVALLDIGLPGLSGYDLARALRQDTRTRYIRLVALTGWGQVEDRARARDAGFDAHLTKPAEPETILATISEMTSA